MTLFSEGLLWALRGGAIAPPEDGIDVWHVPVRELIHRLPGRVKAAAAAENADQSVDVAGTVLDGTVQAFSATPKAQLTIDLDPADARPASRGMLKRGGAPSPVVTGFTAWPFQQPVDAGLYLFRVESDAPFLGVDDVVDVRPPEKTTRFTVPQ